MRRIKFLALVSSLLSYCLLPPAGEVPTGGMPKPPGVVVPPTTPGPVFSLFLAISLASLCACGGGSKMRKKEVRTNEDVEIMSACTLKDCAESPPSPPSKPPAKQPGPTPNPPPPIKPEPSKLPA